MNLKFSKILRGLPVLFLTILSFASLQVSAQNCTVNAGVPESICPGQKMVLKGVYTGLFTSTAVWSQVGGPAVTIGTPVISGSDITANVTGYSPGNTYTFRISARCQDGSQIFQDVVFTTLAATKATVGSNITSCPGTIMLTGNQPGLNETGDWSIITRAYGMHINSSSAYNSTVNLPTDSTASAVFKWTIINTNGCASAAQMTVTNIGANPTITAGGNQTLSNCYNLTQSTQLGASYGGNGFMGQQGTWSFVSGPGTPTFSDIHNKNSNVSNLITGVYRLRWTVAGPCANGSAEMTITVPPPTQSVTGSGSANLIFCDSRTATVLNATIPGYTNEVGTWTVENGTATLSDLHAPSITVTNLVPPTFTRLRYTIHNSVTGCTTAGDFNITYSPQVSVGAINGPITVLPSTATAVTIPYTYTGGNQTLWQLVAAPLGSTLAVSGTTAYQNIDESPIDLTGLDKVGTYNFRLARVTNNAGQGGCENAFADLAIVISQPPTAANAGTSGAVACNVLTTTLAGNAPTTGTGYWSQVSGPSTVVFADIYDRATGISNLVNGSYTFRWIITGGYGAIDAQADVNVAVASMTPTTADAGPSQLVCNQTPIKLAANTPALNETGTWTINPVAGTFVNIHDPNTKLTGLADNSSYTLTWTIANSCGTSFSTTTITTSNTAGPKAAVAGSPQCLSSTATVFNLSGNAPTGLETGTWALVSGPNSPLITSTSSNTTTVTGVVNGTYKFEWSLNTPTCTATRDTVVITASAAATVATVTTTPINLCNETVITLAGNTPAIGTGKWTQVGGPGGAVITDPFSPTSTVTGLITGSYIFRWTISNGSCSSNSADVKYNNSAPPVTPTVGADIELCGVSTTALTGNIINPGQGLWKVVSGPNTPNFTSFTNPTASISGLVTGIYKLVWTSSNGANCGISESRELNVTVRANATASVASSGLCNATVAQLTGNNGSTGTWTFISGSSTPTLTPNSNFTAIASNLVNGTYTFKYTIPAAGACVVTSSATVSINITASPSAAQAGIDQTLCSATFVTLGADVPAIGTGTWTIISQPGTGAAFVNANSPTTNISTATPGVYLLQWNVTNGNCGTNQDIVRITTSSPPTTSVAGANQLTACSGNLTLIANTPSVGVGTWTQVTSMTGTIDAPNSPVTAVNGTIPGSYTFMWTIANGSCPSSTSTVDITVSSIPPNPATPGPAQSICNVAMSATATLAGSIPISGETGVWTIASKPGGASPTFADATLYNTAVNNLIAGEYQFTWTVSNGSCVSFSTVTITVTDAPTPSNPGPDQSICLYKPVLMHATAVTVGIGTWSVTSQPVSTPDVVFSDVNSPTTDVNGLAAGDYVFTWITTNGSACATSMSNTTVHIVQPPTPALAGSFQTVCLGVNPILAANSPTFGVGAWTVTTSAGGTPAFTPSINANNATVTGLVAGVYSFSWTITNGGCTSDDYVQVTVQPAIGNNEIHTPQTICSGTTAAGLTGTAPTGGDGTTYNYQWQRSTTSDVAGFASIPGATSATYGPGTLTTTTWYRRLVSSGTCSPGTFSNTLEITVQPPLANNVITAPITTTFCETGDPDVITGLSATGGDGVTYNYQWEQSTTSASAGFTAITGATSMDYDPATLTVSTWFRRTVSSGACAFITSPATKITINPYATLTSLQSLAPVCNGTVLTYSPTASIAGTTFTWTRPAIASINTNAAGSGSGAFSETLTSTDVVPVPVTYLYSLTVTGCTNPTAYTVTVNVNPTPTVVLPASQLVCKGLTTTTVVFTGSPVANTVYNWSISNTAIGVGLAATGTGNINSFVTANATNLPVSATITVTPVSNTCSGAPQSFTIVVNPVAFAVTVAQSVCSGAPFTIAPTNGSGNIIPAGTTYSWSAPTGAASADGAAGSVAANITGTLSHTSNTALTAVYMVTPNTAACGDGPVFSITITVSPVAAITPISITMCAGITFYMTPTQTTDGVVPSGTLYSWSAPTITGGLIGGATGTNLNSVRGTLYNTTTAAATATYIVTPASGTCIGATFIATASILPRAVIISQMTVTTCSGVAFDFTPTDGTGGNIIPAGTTLTWPTPTGASLTGGAAQAIGIDHVFGTFANSSNTAKTVQYNIIPLSGACTGVTYSVTATILPIVSIAPTTPQFTRVICSGTMFSVTPVNTTNGIVPSTTLYRWSAPTTTGTLTGISTSTNSSQITGTLNNPGSTAQTATFIITPSTSCGDGASFTVIVTVEPMAAITPITTTLCGGTPFSISPTDGVNGIVPAGTLYSWAMPTNSGNYSGGATGSLTGTISATLLNKINTAVAAVYTVTPTTNFGCIGSAFTVTININPTAQITAMTNVICNGASFTSIPVNIVDKIVPAGTTYAWLAPTGSGFSGGLSGAGSSITGTLANSTSIAHSATYIVTPTSGSCTGNTFTITVTVNPIAAVTDMTATTCSGVMFSATPVDVTNGTVPASTMYTWGVPAVSGITGGVANSLTNVSNINGLLTNITTATAVAVYTVTPTTNGCTGAQFTVTVTVEPSAQVTPMSTTVCGGSLFTVVPTNTTDGRIPPATTYSWLALPTPTGVAFTGGATATGSANISGTLLNTTNVMRTATYLVTPLTVGCTGAVFSVTVNINPLAQVTSMNAITCSGITFNLTPVNVVNGIVPTGITYSWTVFSVTGGITGAIPGSGQTLITGTLLNPTSTQQTVTYTVTPNTSTCGNGPAFTVTVSVNPTATVTVPLSLTTCGGVAFTITPTDITHGNLPVGTRFSWVAPTGSGFNGGAVGSNAPAVTGTIVNTTSTVTTAFYAVTTVSGVCTGAPFTVTVTLNPEAIITQMTGTSCSGTAFTITPTDITNHIVPPGTTYTWAAPTGSNLSVFASGAGADISGTLTNSVNVARTATYMVTPTSVTGNCTGDVFSIVVTIDPRAYITAIANITCSGVAFTVSPTNLTNGVVPAATTYRWNTPSLTGSLTGEASGSGASFISGNLTNTSSVAQTATYTVIPTNACGDGPSFTVTVTVNPSAVINPISTATCSALTFTVTPTDPANGTIPTGTTYTWGVPSVTGGITGGAAKGTASATVFGLLTNPTNSVQTATYTVTPLSGSCTGAQFTVTVTLNPKASITAMVATTCNGVTFTASPAQGTNGTVPAGTTYSWGTPTGSNLTGGATGSGAAMITGTLTNGVNVARTATYIVTPLSGSCTGATFTLVVTVTPSATINALNSTVCSGATFTVSPTTANGIVPAGTLYTWGLPDGTGFTGGATGSSASFISGTLVNTTNAAVTATYIVSTVSAGCNGTTFTLVVTVNPTPTVNAISNQVLCNGIMISPVTFTGAVVNTTYSWTNNLAGIGLAASGTGNINAFTATNVSAVPVNAMITVTPVSNTCVGSATTFTITVNPTPTVNTVTSQVLCNGLSSTAVNFTGFVANTTYTWTQTNATIGLAALTGTGNIASFTATNPSAVPVNTVITVTPSSNTCNGATTSFSIVVNPTVTVNTVADQVLCNGTLATAVNFSGFVANTTYVWSRAGGNGIGLPLTATGNISAFTATNASAVPVVAVITVTPMSNSCTGTPATFSITVNPTPTVNTVTSQIVCNGFSTTAINFTGFVGNTTYQWVNTNASIGIGVLTGTGNIGVFTGTNPTAVPVTSIFAVTPFSNSCSGAMVAFSITINPIPTADQIASQVICNGTLTSAINFTGFVAGTVYSWTNNTPSIGLAISGAGNIASFTGTNATSSPVTAVIIVTPLSNTCTGAAMAFTITINPTATLTSTLSPSAICSNTTFSYTATSAVSGATFAWSRVTVNGITSGGAGTGTGDINQTLISSNNTQTNVAYVYTVTANGCTNPLTYTVTVPVSAVASVNAVTAASCAGVAFTKTPANITDGIVPAGTTYVWSAPVQSGVTGGVAQGAAVTSLSGTLVNTTNAVGTAVYIVTPTSGACTGSTFTLTVTIDPKAIINPLTSTICSGATFTVTPSDITSGIVPVGTIYSWNAPTATGITGAVTGSGEASVSSTLVNTTNISRTITYIVTPLSNGCAGNVFSVTVTVDPKPAINAMTAVTHSGGTFFAGPLNGTNGVVPTVTNYTWTLPVVTGGITGIGSSGGSFVGGGAFINPTNSAQTVTYTVTPTAGNCVGATFTVTVTVYPVASINALTVTTCSGVAFSVTPTHPTDGSIPTGTVYRWSAPSGTGFTGGAAAMSQTTVGGSLVNTTTAPVTATYIVTPTSGGYDGATFTVTVTVNPNPVLSSTLTPADICSGSPFAYTVTSATAGSVFSWSRTTVSGITSGGAATGTGDIIQTLSNGTTSPLTVTYVYSITANGCTNPSAGSVAIIVNPIPVLNSTLTPPDVYNATVFNYTATSLTPGTNFTWSRAAIAAINSNTTGSGVGALISETLTTTNPSLTAVVYAITLTANGCTNAQTITVNVSPTPGLSSPLNPAAICSGIVFGYTATSATPATTYTWTRAAISSINSNAGSSGSNGVINEILTNSSNVPVSVVYTVMLTANSFTSTQNVTVVVNPTPSATQPGAQVVCNNTLTTGVTFSGSVAGSTYNWTNNNTAIGLAAAGSATISAFTATNSTASVITAIITVIPVSNTCAGPVTTFTITVNPTPLLSSTLTPTGICTGNAFSYIATSATTGTSYAWSRTTVAGITSGGPGTGTGDVTGQTHSNSTTAPLSVQYVYTLTANSCSNIQTVTVAVNPTPALTSTLSPTAVFGGSAFTYSPTSATPSVVYTWARGTVTGISNVAGSGTGAVNESLINVTASTINVTYTYTLTAGGCSNSQTVTIGIIPSNIDAVDDDFSASCVNGATGGTTASVLSNDVLNSTAVNPASVNMTILSDGGITGVTFNSSGQLVIPARTTEGTYSLTYRICVSANPTNCDQATVVLTVCRGLLISVTPVCINDVPYVYYKIEPNFIAGAVNPVTLTWVNGDHSVVAAQPVAHNLALEGRILWPGAAVDSLGNGLDWPGWYLQNGVWIQGADGFEGTRPNAYLRISVNPTDSILFSYPPATPACNANPVSRPPVAVNDTDSSGQCMPVILNVLANDYDPEGGALAVSLPSVTSAHGAGLVVNASGTVTYTPVAGFTGTDTFDYTITDPQGLTATATVTIKINPKPAIPGGIIGACAVSRDSVKTFSVAPSAGITHYVWTVPAGWAGSSLTSTINVTAGSSAVNGDITVTPYNGGCAGNTLTMAVSIIDYAKVTLTASPAIVKGDGAATSQITITLYDKNGNPIHCSGGIATLCSNYGVFGDVIDNGDGTYTGYLKSSANNVTVCGTVAGVPLQQTVTTTFTGPQGSIKGNGPIFDTETPLLTFNFTEGIGPFTVIYKPQGATKTDTLTNVVNGTPIPVKSIDATKLYTMLSIIGSDNARRDNNFTRDTATILVVAPRIIITLTADNPKFVQDNMYSTVLRAKVRNNGNIDLAQVQVRADLTDVFPNPVQFVLDSVKQVGRQTVPNNNYDGKSNIDLFSFNFNSTPGLRTHMNDVAAVQVPGMAYGNNGTGYTVLNNTDEANGERTQVPFLPGYQPTAEKENSGTTGNNDGPMRTPFFFGILSKLDVGEESEMQLYVRIIPNGYYKPFVMQAIAVGTGHTEFGTSLANSLSNDDGNEALHPELTHNGDPLPTVINVFPNPVLGVAMNATTPVLQGNGTYNVTLNYLLKNYGNVNLRQVKLFEELTRSIGSPATFNIVSAPVATGNLIANPSYNGTTDTAMLASNSSIGVGTDATVTVTINITPNQLSALYRAFAIGTGFNNELGNTVTDISSNGTDPDPDGNGVPDERLITLIPINMSIPPLVPAKIGIQDSPTTTVLEKTYCGSTLVTVVPTQANTGGVDAYTYQWQRSIDNVIFTNIAGETGSTLANTFAGDVYLRRITISGDQEAASNAVHVIIGGPAKPVITASGSLTLTMGGSITLSSSTAPAYLWSTSATGATISVSSVGNYTVTVTDANGCKATSDLVTVKPPPATTIADIQKITSRVPVLQADGSFLVDFTIRASNLTAQQLDSVKITDDLRAVFPASVQFQVAEVKASGKLIVNELYNGNSQIDLLADGSVLPALQKDSITLSVKIIPNGFSGLLKNSAVQTARSPNYGTLNVTSNDPSLSNGITSREPTQFVIPAVDIFIPSGFSPNRDGVNDVFVITRPFNTTINMEIYNRWGNLVYRSRDYKNDWGGKGNQPNNILGEDLPDGTYYYVVLATDNATGTVRKFAAFITLKR